MGDSWRIGVEPTERTALVTTHPFGLVRNPIFTAAVTTFTRAQRHAVGGLLTLIVGIELQVGTAEEPK